MKKMKKIDFKIINIIVKDASVKVKDLAKMCNISEKTVRNRLEILGRENMISRKFAVNPTKFGYNIKFDVFIKLSGNMDQLIELLNEKYYFNILYIGTHWGDDDISAQLVFKNAWEVTEFKENCNKLKSIKSVTMTMVPIVFKDTYDWIPNPKDIDSSFKEEEVAAIKNIIKK